MNRGRINFTLLLFFFASLASVPAVYYYDNGYRLSLISGVYKTGDFYIYSPAIGADVFVDGKKISDGNGNKNWFFIPNLKPGNHLITVAKKEFWPWQKALSARGGKTTEAKAMLVLKEPKGKTLMSPAKDFPDLSIEDIAKRGRILKDLLYSQNSGEKISGSEKIFFGGERKQLFAEWLGDKKSAPYFFCDEEFCDDNVLILDSKFEIKSADFYPGRKDLVIVSVDNGVYAIEIDARGGRMLQPVYKGKNPVSITYENDPYVYVFDENSLLQISLE